MSIIAQEPTPKFKPSIFDKEVSKDEIMDEFQTHMFLASFKTPNELAAMCNEAIRPVESRHSKVTSMFEGPPKPSVTEPKSTRTLKTKAGTTYTPLENDDAQKKFGGAKAISSEQFFANESSSLERSANLAKFQGSNSISSADYFGDDTGKATNRG